MSGLLFGVPTFSKTLMFMLTGEGRLSLISGSTPLSSFSIGCWGFFRNSSLALRILTLDSACVRKCLLYFSSRLSSLFSRSRQILTSWRESLSWRSVSSSVDEAGGTPLFGHKDLYCWSLRVYSVRRESRRSR